MIQVTFAVNEKGILGLFRKLFKGTTFLNESRFVRSRVNMAHTTNKLNSKHCNKTGEDKTKRWLFLTKEPPNRFMN